jgi:pyrroline-5-carboxylate reductase
MNEIIPVNGSMPAFLYYFVEAYIDDATSYGIPYETAKHLACEAVIGSAKMILETGKPIEELINDVCSPGGATLEGLRVLKENNFQEIIKESNKACIKRAYELSNK